MLHINLSLVSTSVDVHQHWQQLLQLDAFTATTCLPSTSRQPDSTEIVLFHIENTPSIQNALQLVKQGYPVIACASEPTAEQAAVLFSGGVKGYLNTYSTVERFQQAMATVAAGQVWVGQNMMKRMIAHVEQGEANHWHKNLTEREIQTAKLLLQGSSNLEIADTLTITQRTVKKYVSALLTKFNARDRLDLVLKIQATQHPSSSTHSIMRAE